MQPTEDRKQKMWWNKNFLQKIEGMHNVAENIKCEKWYIYNGTVQITLIYSLINMLTLC